MFWPGKPKTWVEPLLAQLCSFIGEGSLKHDDFVDSTTQALRVVLDKHLVRVTAPETFDDEHASASAYGRALIRPRDNPYAA